MRVVCCTFDEPRCIAGPNSWLQRLLPALRNRGIESEIIVLATGDPSFCPTVRALTRMGFRCYCIRRGDDVHKEVAAILHHVARTPPDVFIPNCIIPALYAARWVRKAGIPTVAVIHSDDPFYRAVIDRFIVGEQDYKVSAVVCVSDFLTNTCIERGVDAAQVRRIVCGVECDEGHVDQRGEAFRIAYLGRFVEEQKRISDVARALCLACQSVPGVEACLYGDGEDRHSVERIVREEGAGLPISIGPLLSPSEVRRELAAYHALVLLSDYEGLPLVVLEAMSVGVVPICTQMRSGINELVEDGRTGLLVSDRGPDFVRAVRSLASDRNNWKQMSESARIRIAQRFSNDICADQWADLIKSLANEHALRLPIPIPVEIRLPRPHPDLVWWDTRIPTLCQRATQIVKKNIVRALRSMRVYPR